MHNVEQQFLSTLEHVMINGVRNENRTGIDTLMVPFTSITHDFKNGFPLLTTKRMAKKTMATELEAFIGGITDKEWLKSRGCNIWNEWCNPELLKPFNYPADQIKQVQSEQRDLGPIYGYQWRRFNKKYYDGEYNSAKFSAPKTLEEAMAKGDQLATVIHKLKTNPADRRLVVSAWNPLQFDQMALPPCHTGFSLQNDGKRLHLTWTQRSCDFLLGVPFDLACYGLLLVLICKEVGMEPGTVTGCLSNSHIYVNHIEQVKEQISREQFPLPTLSIDNWTNIWEWEATDCVWENYQCHPAIKAEVAV